MNPNCFLEPTTLLKRPRQSLLQWTKLPGKTFLQIVDVHDVPTTQQTSPAIAAMTLQMQFTIHHQPGHRLRPSEEAFDDHPMLLFRRGGRRRLKQCSLVTMALYDVWTWLVGGLEHVIFPYIGKNHPNWLIFFIGVETTNQMINNPLEWGTIF